MGRWTARLARPRAGQDTGVIWVVLVILAFALLLALRWRTVKVLLMPRSRLERSSTTRTRRWRA